MAVEIFHDQVSMKECARRGDLTRGRLHAKRARFRSSYRTRSAEEKEITLKSTFRNVQAL